MAILFRVGILCFTTLMMKVTEMAIQKPSLEANKTYIGMAGKRLTLKWTYASNKAYENVEIYMPDLTASTKAGSQAYDRLWQIKYNPKNKTFVKRKFNVAHSVFNNLTELVRQGSEFYLKIKSVPRNLTTFAFTFRVKEQDAWKPPEEKEITVKVAVPPAVKITVDKGNAVHVQKGRDINIRCIATGFPIPEIEIKKDFISLATSKPSSNDVILKLENFQPANAGRYVCTAKSMAGLASNDVVITISYIELKETASLRIHSTLGSTEELHCPIEGYPPVIYSWFNGNKQLSSYRESRVNLDRHNKFGNYSCVGQNDAGQKQVTFSILMDTTTMEKRVNNGSLLNPALISFVLSIMVSLWNYH